MSKQAKHTPGPWKLKNEGTIVDADGGLIATTGYRVTAIDDQDAPNARLIAAAPDLLAALEGLIRHEVNISGAARAYVHDARVAVAKAKGE